MEKHPFVTKLQAIFFLMGNMGYENLCQLQFTALVVIVSLKIKSSQYNIKIYFVCVTNFANAFLYNLMIILQKYVLQAIISL
jgi:hypothetical protein